MKVISLDVLLKSDLISSEESRKLIAKYAAHPWLTVQEIIKLDLPARSRIEALLQSEFLTDSQLRELACDFAEHTLHIFEDHAPEEWRPHKCVEAARTYLTGATSLEDLQAAIKDAIPVVWKFEGTEFISAFEAGLVVTFLDYKDAAEMVRLIARRTQSASHHRVMESSMSSVQPMVSGEGEAEWQLGQIMKKLC